MHFTKKNLCMFGFVLNRLQVMKFKSSMLSFISLKVHSLVRQVLGVFLGFQIFLNLYEKIRALHSCVLIIICADMYCYSRSLCCLFESYNYARKLVCLALVVRILERSLLYFLRFYVFDSIEAIFKPV